ncbi:MAG: ERAP1-like C-terminal domain-containing protein [Deltaproteobacteria bacterium]|nr:ERAP1-like C-terminal domain-containing protein [Deltaproteobacteria bacterium]
MHALPLLALAALALPANAAVVPRTAAPVDEPAPKMRLPTDVRPLSAELSFDLDPKAADLTGRARWRVRLPRAQRALWLHGRGMQGVTATVAAQRATWTQVDDDGLAKLSFDQAVGPGDVDVALSWRAPLKTDLEGVYKVDYAGEPYVFTQFEAIDARESFPCFDEPGFKLPIALSITTPKGNIAVANAPLQSSTNVEGGTRYSFKATQPIPIYLLAFAVGPLDVVDGPVLPKNALRDRPLPLRGVAPRGQGAQLQASLALSAQIIAWLEQWFGVAYPYDKLDIVAVPDFAAGAMENAGLVTFRDALLYVDNNSPIGLQKGNAYVIAHEFAHQWFGNLVTMAWWDDVWLNEAFASWMENLAVNAVRPDFNALTEARAGTDWVSGEDSLVSARQIRQPVLSKGDIINAFDGITYTKGAAVIGMFERWLGTKAFQQGVRAYMAEHRFGNATAKDLLDALSRNGRRDVATPFSTFLDQPGIPYVEAKLSCEGAPALELKVSRFLPVGSTGDRNKRWGMPVCARALGADGKWTESCALVDGREGKLPLAGATCPKAVHPNSDGAGYYRWSLPPDQLKALVAHLKELTPGERISLQNALRAGYASGTLPFADALAGAEPLARDVEPTVARAPSAFLWNAHDDLVEPGARAKVKARMASIYRPVLDAVGKLPKAGEDPRARERRELAWDMLAGAEDKAALAELAKLGRAALGLDGPVAEIPADLKGAAIDAAVKQGGAPVFDKLVERLATENDPMMRRYLVSALGSVDEEPLAGRARALSLDLRLKTNEVLSPLWAQAGDVRTRDATWAFVKENVDALIKRLPETFGADALPGLAGGYCSEERAAEIDGFFKERAGKVPGMERALAQAVEGVRLCAAKAAVHRDSARKAFK